MLLKCSHLLPLVQWLSPHSEVQEVFLCLKVLSQLTCIFAIAWGQSGLGLGLACNGIRHVDDLHVYKVWLHL